MSKKKVSPLEAARLKKLSQIEELGHDPWGQRFDGHIAIRDAREKCPEEPGVEGEEVRIAGRIMLRRKAGKLRFYDIKDWSGQIQLLFSRGDLPDELWTLMSTLDLGDLIGIDGVMLRTQSGEVSVMVRGFQILCKSLAPPPEKFHGAQDTEMLLRQRYIDLIYNDGVLNRMLQRTEILTSIRQTLRDHGFVEVETPVLHAIAGGAAARPFITHHNALDIERYLRIALELHLKRLMVGGIERVYEIGRVFRNEGIDATHNPEFTMIEIYQAYGNYETMMDLLQSMICQVAEKVCGTLVIEQKDTEGNVTQTIDLTPDWRRVKYKDLVREKVGDDWFSLTPEQRREKAVTKHQIEIGPEEKDFEVTNAIFEKLVEPTLIQPTFVTHLPMELVPLAKLSPDEPDCVEVFECCINGQEIAPAYTEQNNPIEQRERLEQQAGGEQQKLDEDFLVALEHGMPPAGGIGIGIDRLCIMLLGQESIRDVILFPQLKPRDDSQSFSSQSADSDQA